MEEIAAETGRRFRSPTSASSTAWVGWRSARRAWWWPSPRPPCRGLRRLPLRDRRPQGAGADLEEGALRGRSSGSTARRPAAVAAISPRFGRGGSGAGRGGRAGPGREAGAGRTPRQHPLALLRRHRRAPEVALHLVAPQRAEERHLRLRLDAEATTRRPRLWATAMTASQSRRRRVVVAPRTKERSILSASTGAGAGGRARRSPRRSRRSRGGRPPSAAPAGLDGAVEVLHGVALGISRWSASGSRRSRRGPSRRGRRARPAAARAPTG